MRILHVVPSYLPASRYGGPIQSVHGLCKALASRGHEIEVATTSVDGDRDSDVPLGTAVPLDGVKVHYFRSGILRRLYYSGSMYRFLAASLEGFDLVHTHSVFLWPTSAAARLARKLRRPYVLSPRGMLVRDLIGSKSTLVKSAWIRLIERRNVAGAAAIHVTSKTEADALLQLELGQKRIFEVPNGVALPDPIATSPNTAVDEWPRDFVLFLGRVSWKKGLDRLVDAMVHLPSVHVVVAGNDDEDYWPTVSRQAAKNGVSDRLHYVGFVEGSRKWELLARASLLALPSYSENFGNVILEAMAAGTPVVVTPEVGLAATVASRDCGLVANGDAMALSGAIRKVLTDAELQARLGANGRRAAHAFSWDAVAGSMESEYLSIVDASIRTR